MTVANGQLNEQVDGHFCARSETGKWLCPAFTSRKPLAQCAKALLAGHLWCAYERNRQGYALLRNS